jgi:hypothetical protein
MTSVGQVIPVRVFRILWAAFSSLFALVGIGVMAWGFSEVYTANCSKGWPQADGTILSSEIGQHSGGEGGTTYSADISYEFTVNGETIKGSRVRFGEVTLGNQGVASKIVNKYKPGTKVKIHYNPKDPYDSVLEPGVHGMSTWFTVIFGLVFAVAAAGFMAVGLFVTGKMISRIEKMEQPVHETHPDNQSGENKQFLENDKM